MIVAVWPLTYEGADADEDEGGAAALPPELAPLEQAATLSAVAARAAAAVMTRFTGPSKKGSVGAPEGPAAVDVKGSPAAVVAGEDLRDVDSVLGLEGNQRVALKVDQLGPLDLADQLGH